MTSLRNYLALRFLILSLLTFFDGFTGNITWVGLRTDHPWMTILGISSK